MINGVINVRKEKGMTSFGVVSRMRRIFDQKKIGHTGTLDPDAEGVLPVCLGKATRLVETLSRGTKSYRAVLLLGMTTDTQDAGGTVLSTSDPAISEEALRALILSFQGKQQQLPPMYSALKVDGKKLVDLARRGIEVERKTREVEFSEMEVHSVCLPRAEFSVTCTHGAYIRTLCHDIGAKAGCGAVMESLLRTRVGEFFLEDACTLDELREMKAREDTARDCSDGRYSFVRPIDHFFRDLPALTVSGSALPKLLNGRDALLRSLEPRSDVPEEGGRIRVYAPDGAFVGIYERRGDVCRLHKMYYS